MMPYSMEYPFGQFKSAVLILLPPSSLSSLLQKALDLYSTAEQQLQTSVSYQHCFSPRTQTELKPNHTRHSEKKNDPILAETKTKFQTLKKKSKS